MPATEIDSANAGAMAAPRVAAAEAALTAAGAEKRDYVQRMFSDIAPRYDLLNHLLSLNLDRAWRRRAIAELNVRGDPSGVYLDLCTGTLDVAAAIAGLEEFSGFVLGADFAEPMLKIGKAKVSAGKAAPAAADALRLPSRDKSFSGAIVAFGIRNVADLDAALRETFRVLAPAARFVILEFSLPKTPLRRALYQAYFNYVLPVLGRLISGHRTAYTYLPRSVASFPVQEELAARMRSAGFSQVRWSNLTLGVVAIHVGVRAA